MVSVKAEQAPPVNAPRSDAVRELVDVRRSQTAVAAGARPRACLDDHQGLLAPISPDEEPPRPPPR